MGLTSSKPKKKIIDASTRSGCNKLAKECLNIAKKLDDKKSIKSCNDLKKDCDTLPKTKKK